jgi:hypothetical protein
VIKDAEDFDCANIHAEMAAPGAARATGQRADVGSGGNCLVMAQLRLLVRLHHARVADVRKRSLVLVCV